MNFQKADEDMATFLESLKLPDRDLTHVVTLMKVIPDVLLNAPIICEAIAMMRRQYGNDGWQRVFGIALAAVVKQWTLVVDPLEKAA
jgi:hypothetical protein